MADTKLQLPPEWNEVLMRPFPRWGVNAQLSQLQEEAAEVIVAVSHYRRNRSDIDAVLDEAADLMSVLLQLRETFGAVKFDALLTQKIEELRTRLG